MLRFERRNRGRNRKRGHRCRVEDNAIYVLQFDGSLLVKRVQRKLDGSVVVRSDNPLYEPETLKSAQAEALKVIGRVVWMGVKV